MAGDVTAKAGQHWDKLESIFEERTAKALNKLGVPSRQGRGRADRAHRRAEREGFEDGEDAAHRCGDQGAGQEARAAQDCGLIRRA